MQSSKLNRPIGILDSGIGGLSIWREIIRQLPNESTIYIADSKNCPYGVKSHIKVYKLAKNLVQFLINQRVKLVVLACNTITVSCLDRLRSDFPKIPIIGTVPVIKTAAEETKNKKIGILSTLITSKSLYQKNLIQKFSFGYQVLNVGTNTLVPLIEKGEVRDLKFKNILKKELDPFIEFGIDTLVLGCSHFPFIKNQIQEILGEKIAILDSQGAIARQAERILQNTNALVDSLQKSSHLLYTTGDLCHFKKVIKKLMPDSFVEMKIKKAY